VRKKNSPLCARGGWRAEGAHRKIRPALLSGSPPPPFSVWRSVQCTSQHWTPLSVSAFPQLDPDTTRARPSPRLVHPPSSLMTSSSPCDPRASLCCGKSFTRCTRNDRAQSVVRVCIPLRQSLLGAKGPPGIRMQVFPVFWKCTCHLSLEYRDVNGTRKERSS